MNAWRQLITLNTCTTSSGVNAPPQRALIHRIPCAFTLSLGGSHAVKAFVKLGKQPASPAPNRNRVTTIEAKFQAQPVAAVKNDHHTTMRISTRRAPITSPIQPPGISHSAYARVNAENIRPVCARENRRSSEIRGAACEMQTRSM